MTGAVAAMAEPPQIDEPTPTRIDVLEGTCNIFLKSHAIRSEIEMNTASLKNTGDNIKKEKNIESVN